jgi:hypothetical protein
MGIATFLCAISQPAPLVDHRRLWTPPLKERLEPFTVAREDGYAVSQYGKGWFLYFRHLLDSQFQIEAMDMWLRSSPYNHSDFSATRSPGRNLPAKLVKRRIDLMVRTAIANALGCPMITTNCLPRVTPV